MAEFVPVDRKYRVIPLAVEFVGIVRIWPNTSGLNCVVALVTTVSRLVVIVLACWIVTANWNPG